MTFARLLHRGPALVVSERAEMNRVWFESADPERDSPALLHLDGRALLDVHAVHRPSGSMLVLEGLFRHSATGGTETGDDHWRRLSVATAEENDAIAQCLRDHFGLPRSVLEVPRTELQADPGRFHGKLVRTWADWDRGFERSSFAGAWIVPPFSWTGTFRAEVTGLWLSQPGERYGHLGASPSNLVVFDFALLDKKGADGWTIPSNKLIVRTTPRDVVFEAHPSDDTMCRVRVHGRAIPMRYSRIRRLAPFTHPDEPVTDPPAGNVLEVLVPEGPAAWVPLSAALRSDGIFRTSGQLRLEREGFETAAWIIGFRDAAGVSHSLQMTFAPRNTSVRIRWMEVPEHIPDTPYTAPEEIVRSLRRLDLESTKRRWASLRDEQRRQFEWPAFAREQLVAHGFDGAEALFGVPVPPRPKVMTSSTSIEAFATLYRFKIESPTLTQDPDGRVVVGGRAPTEEAREAVVTTLRAAGFWVDDRLLTAH